MDDFMTAVQDIELALSELEQRLDLPSSPEAVDERIRVAWHCFDPAGLSILLGSIVPLQSVCFPVTADSCFNSQLPPVMLSWAESPKLSIKIQSPVNVQLTPALKNSGISTKALSKAAAAGFIKTGANIPAPWNIADTDILLNILFDTINAVWLPDISSITFSAPLERLRHLEIQAGSNSNDTSADVQWVVLPSHELTGDEKSRIQEWLSASDTVVFPFIDVSRLLNDAAVADKGFQHNFQTLIRQYEKTFSVAGAEGIFPFIPIGIIAGVTTNAISRYMLDSLNLAWETVLPAGSGSSEIKHAIDSRSQAVIDSALASPTSICGLLRQKKILSDIKALPEFQVVHPAIEPFNVMQKKGIAVFSDAAEMAVEQLTAEKTALHHQRVGMLQKFLNSLQTVIVPDTDAAQIVTSIINDPALDRLIDDDDGIAGLGDKIERVFDTAITTLEKEDVSCRKELKKSVPEPDTVIADRVRQESEAAEQHEYIWGTLIRLDLNKMKLKIPSQEMQQLLAVARNDFLDYLNLTPADEKEFSRCLTTKWPGVAKKYSKKMHRLMDDTCQLWEISVNQELDKIEEYRQEHLPRSPKFPVDIVLKKGEKPSIADVLDVKLRKPALTAKLFNNQEKGLWRSESVLTIQKAADSRLTDFEASIEAWFDAVSHKIDAVKQKVFTVADGIVNAGKDAAETRIIAREEKARKLKELHEQCETRLTGLAAKKAEIVKSQAKWHEIKELLHNTECVA